MSIAWNGPIRLHHVDGARGCPSRSDFLDLGSAGPWASQVSDRLERMRWELFLELDGHPYRGVAGKVD